VTEFCCSKLVTNQSPRLAAGDFETRPIKTVGTIQHTWIMLHADRDARRGLIRAIAHHELDDIDQVVKRHAAVTADCRSQYPGCYEAKGRSARVARLKACDSRGAVNYVKGVPNTWSG